MEKTYQFPDIPKKCKACGLKLAGKRVELGYMRGSQPMGYCPECGYAYQIVEIESEPETEPEPEPCPVCGKTHKEGSAISEEHKAEAKAKAEADADPPEE